MLLQIYDQFTENAKLQKYWINLCSCNVAEILVSNRYSINLRKMPNWINMCRGKAWSGHQCVSCSIFSWLIFGMMGVRSDLNMLLMLHSIFDKVWFTIRVNAHHMNEYAVHAAQHILQSSLFWIEHTVGCTLFMFRCAYDTVQCTLHPTLLNTNSKIADVHTVHCTTGPAVKAFAENAHFQLPKNETLSTRFQKRSPPFHANIPPQWWNRHLFYVFTTFGWELGQFLNLVLFRPFLHCKTAWGQEKLQIPQNHSEF